MRVITGSARGRRLLTLEGDDVRPTTDKVKEAIFSAIQFDIEGRTFLDLFAGSGQIGLYDKGRVLHADSLSFIGTITEKFDIVFLDPPYGTGILQKALPEIAEKVKKTGVIIAENSENEEISANYGEFMLDRQKHYGKIKVTMYRHRDFV